MVVDRNVEKLYHGIQDTKSGLTIGALLLIGIAIYAGYVLL